MAQFEFIPEVNMEFDWWLAGPDGAGFCLMPIRNVHTAEEVERAKRILHHERDVVGRIQVEWQEQPK